MASRTPTSLTTTLERAVRVAHAIKSTWSACIFLPAGYPEVPDAKDFQLEAFCTNGQGLVNGTFLDSMRSPVGWVAQQRSTVHLPSLECGTESLGYYIKDEGVRSFAGFPINLPDSDLCGVLTLDAREPDAFCVGELAAGADLAQLISLSICQQSYNEVTSSRMLWVSFVERAVALGSSLGIEALDLLRVKLLPFTELEGRVGTYQALKIFDHALHLLENSLPNQFPIFRLPSGDILLLLDGLMTRFFEDKIRLLLSDRGTKNINLHAPSLSQTNVNDPLLIGFNRSKLLVDSSDKFNLSSKSKSSSNSGVVNSTVVNSTVGDNRVADSRSATVIPLSRAVDLDVGIAGKATSLESSDMETDTSQEQFVRMEALLADALDTPLIELRSQVGQKF